MTESERYEDLVSEIYSDGNFFRTSYDFFLVLPITEGTIWGFLINQDYKVRSSRRRDGQDYDGWFPCSMALIKKRFQCFSENQERRVVTFLTSKGYLYVKRKGIPAKRYFKLNLEGFRKDVLRLRSVDSQESYPVGIHGSSSSSQSLTETAQRSIKTLCPDPHPRGLDVEDKEMNGFWTDENSHANGDSTPIQSDTGFASLLRKAVESRCKVILPWSRKKWANEFRQLRQSLSGDASRIQRVLEWYCDHLGKEYIPQAYCAQTFRKKFASLESAHARHLKEHPEVNISTDAVRIADRLKNMGWPKGSKTQLQLVAELSLQGYKEFTKKVQDFIIRAAMNKLPDIPKPRLATYLRLLEMVRSRMQSAGSWVQWWLEKVHDRIKGWEAWSGDLKPYAFRDTHKDFLKEVCGWTQEYCSNPDLWDRLAKELG